MTDMQTFYVTMGVQYRNENHPDLTFAQANPDGYLIVRAVNERYARDILGAVIGNRYAFLYTEAEFDPSWHPLGCLGEIKHGCYPPMTPGRMHGLLAIEELVNATDEELRDAVSMLSTVERAKLYTFLAGEPT